MSGAHRRGHAAATPSHKHQMPSAEEMGAKHLRGSSLLLIGRVAAMVFTIATNVIMVRYLSKHDFGAFGFAFAISSASRFLLSLGQGKTLSRFLAVYYERREYGKMFGSAVVAIGTVLVSGVLLIAALYLFQDTLVHPFLETSTATSVLLIVILLAPMEALDQVFVSLFAVFTKPRSIFFRKYLFTPVLRLAVVSLVGFTGGGVVLMAIGYVGAQVIGLAIYVTMLRAVFREQGLLSEMRWRKLEWPVRNVFTFALPMLSTELVYLSMNTGSVLLLSHYHGQVGVADLRAVLSPAQLSKIVYTTFLTLYLPMASRLFARRDFATLRSDYWRTAAFLAVTTFPIFAMTGPFAPATTVTLFGERYSSASAILAVLATGYYVNSALGFNMVTLQAYGKVRFLFGVNIFCALLNIGLSIPLTKQHGAIGVAWANCITMVVQNLLNQAGLRSTLHTAIIARGYFLVYASLTAVTVLLWGIQMLWAPNFVICLVLSALASLLLLAINRPALALASSFPELGRIPLVRKLVA